MYHFDIKKIIALSTARQLGFIIFTLSMGMKDVAFFHLLRHGFFKALLFLTRGVIIHQKRDRQDIQKSNFRINFDFFLKNIFYYSNIALMGLPFIGAFFSKHKILRRLREQSFPRFFIILGGLSLCFTVAYRLRLINIIYHKKSIHQTECFSMGYN
jgi:NADH-quinone oxidoreductase subunit L